jgi:integrase/recombinase XerD
MNALTTIQPTTIAVMDESWIIAAWLGSQRSEHTRRAYQSDSAQFLAFAGTPLRNITLDMVQAFHASLEDAGLSSASIARRLSSVKALIKFAFEWKLFPVDLGHYVRLPAVKDTLAERIMSQPEVLAMLNLETNTRNSAILRLGYNAGLRLLERILQVKTRCYPGNIESITVRLQA